MLAVIPLILYILFISVRPLSVKAQSNSSSGNYTLLEPLPCVPTGNSTTCTSGGQDYSQGSYMSSVDFQTYVQYFFNLMIALSAAAAVFMIAIGGIQYMTTDSWQGKGDGKERVKNAVVGLLMVLCSYLILRTVDPRLVAIPATLVPQLQLPTGNTTAAFFNQLESQVQQQNALGQQSVDTASQLQNDATAKQQIVSNLQTQLTQAQNDGNTDLVNSLQAQIATANDQITDDEAQSVVNLAKAGMSSGAVATNLNNIALKSSSGSATADYINQQVTAGVNYIEQTQNTRDEQLEEMGAYSYEDGPGGVDDNANSQEATLKLAGINAIANEAQLQQTFGQTFLGGVFSSSNTPNVVVGSQNLGTPSQASSNLQSQLSTISQQINSIQDPQLKQSLQTQLQTSQNLVKQKIGS